MLSRLFRPITFKTRFSSIRAAFNSKPPPKTSDKPISDAKTRVSSHRSIPCWSCHHFTPIDHVFCTNTSCTKIQKPHAQVSYFDVLLGSESFDIDPKLLRRQFLALQQKCHPDSSMGESQVERDYAVMQSSWLNKAYATLKSPLQRALYLVFGL